MNARNGLALVLAVLIGGSGCAYFNTFYNAKSEFGRAETERKASPSGSGGGEGGYQKCIEKCQSLLRFYPKSKYIDDALFLIGMSRLYRTEYIQSRASLEDLVERFPKSSYVEPALYWMGVAALKQGDAAGAAQAFGKLAEKYPESKLNVEAVFRQAESRLDAKDYQRAREDLRAFMVAHPKSELASEAQLRIARTYYDEQHYDEARAEYAKVLERDVQPNVRYEAQLNSALALRAQAEKVLSNPALQRAQRERLAAAEREAVQKGKPSKKRVKPPEPVPPPAPLRQMPPDSPPAEPEDDGTPDPQLSRIAVPDTAAADSTAEADADTAAVELSADDAKQLQDAEKSIDDVWKQLAALRKPAAKLGLETEHAIEMAVTRALRGEPDDAIDDLDLIVRTKPRTEIAARARYETAEIFRRQGEFAKARDNYDAALKEKPESSVSDRAKRKSNAILLRTSSLDRLRGSKAVLRRWRQAQSDSAVAVAPADTVAGAVAVAKVDSVGAQVTLAADFEALAGEQLRVAEVDLLELDQPLVALREFERVLTDFAGSLQGPRAAFAIAWIQDRRLQDMPRARAAYERIVREFADTPQAREAQDLLDHWDDPDAHREVLRPILTTIIDNVTLSGGSHLLRYAVAEARRAAPVAKPGQFVQILAYPSLRLIRRPMSVHDEGDGWRSVMVKPVGPASRELVALAPGDAVDVSPPLGNGFPDLQALVSKRLLLVGGGFGVAPLHFLARRLDAQPEPLQYTLLYGGRTAHDVELDAVEGLRGPVLASTDDGSRGFHGTCVDLARAELERAGGEAERTLVLTCGSHGMMLALHRALHGRVAQVLASLEEVMACGVGVCMGCVTPSVRGYVPICTEGPVFPSDEVFDVELGGVHV